VRTDYTPSGNMMLFRQCVSNCCKPHITLYTPGAVVPFGPFGAADPGLWLHRLFDRFFGQYFYILITNAERVYSSNTTIFIGRI